MKVVKRDGREEVYNGIKVIKAAESALLESGHTEEEAYRIACAVNEVVANNLPTDQCTISVKNIHILVEDALMDMGLKCAAREYIQYRQTRDNNREAGGKLLADISGFLDRTCDEFTKENANKPDYELGVGVPWGNKENRKAARASRLAGRAQRRRR